MDIYSKKQLEIKKQHHYVWADYMKHWSPNKRNVYYTKKSSGIAYDSVKNVAVERHFYKVGNLNPEHISLINRFIFMSNNKELNTHHQIALKYYLEMQNFHEVYLDSGIKNEYANSVFEAFNNNSLEDKHSELERCVQPISNELRMLNTNVFKNTDEMTDFLLFLGNQITRTKAFKDSFVASFSKQAEICESKLIDDCWWFLSLVFGYNMGEKLCNDMENYQHTILVNETKTPFITADHPVVNIFPNSSNIVPPKESETDYFYPLSPTRAYVASKSGKFTNEISIVDESFVDHVNENISKGAYFHIISNSKESLEPYMKLVGKRMVRS